MHMLEKKTCQGLKIVSLEHYTKESNSSRELLLRGTEDTAQTKLILAYTTIYGQRFDITTFHRTSQEKIQFPNPLTQCKYACTWSTNQSLYNRSDAVLFHLYNNLDHKDFVYQNLPQRYSSEQKWILMIREPPAFFYPEQLKMLDDRFNLTVTFHSSSDVQIPYGKYWSKRTPRPYRNFAIGRNKLALWMVSNCVTSSRREVYVRELQKYLEVDIVGGCLGLFANSTGKYVPLKNVKQKQYKFYLAFENSDCEEYITEKFWKSLFYGMIPVVRGRRAKYEHFAPPHSFIHADEFLSAEELAKYLKRVASNPSLFNQYHKWRNQYLADSRLMTINRQWMCDLCEKVYTSLPKTVNVYDHFSEDTKCDTYQDAKGRNRTGEHVENILRL
ncbi:4-galactosyl-N-acetylglucosaminide 3-alpha-L-fucosyltransferase 9-like [Watersipora subatra]|uniref:4-galactosyl-N-acetylglucosaminide 3-alpha-L-fucosyltransferase 9-like n=1 Tax=Watersipora subatra TaxID=2589382 RepID=UPI00355C48E5